jgi:hypothetical protein
MSFLVLLRLSQIVEANRRARTSDQRFPTGRTLYRRFEACLRARARVSISLSQANRTKYQ